jgi:hypothetical protein
MLLHLNPRNDILVGVGEGTYIFTNPSRRYYHGIEQFISVRVEYRA